MAKFSLVKGEQSVILPVFIQDSSSTTGAGLSGLVHTSSIAGGYVRRNGTGVALAVDEDVTTEGTYQAPSAAGKVRIGTPANMRAGDYELHFHNDLFATGADWVTISLGGATNMAELRIEVQLTDLNLNNPAFAAATNQIFIGTVDTATNSHTPTTTEFQADDITTSGDDNYIGRTIMFTSGTLYRNQQKITDYAVVGGIAQFTTDAFRVAPSNNDTFIVV